MASRDELKRRNLETIRQRLPDVHARLTAITQPLTRLVEEDGEAVDIDLGSGRLYKTDGLDLARRQAADFIETPRRVGYQVTNALSGDSPISQRLFLRLIDSVRDREAVVLPGAPVRRSGFLMVFGLGLGHHLPPLVDGLDVDWIVVLESIDEFALHSMSVIDWTALFEACDRKGAKLSLVLGETPGQLCRESQEIIDVQGELSIDGSYYYRHYPSWALDHAFEDIVNNVPLKMIQRGYYEDERKMLWNAIANLHKYDCQMVPGSFQIPVGPPAFLVASGPSVDHDIEYIKRWRDHVIVFSGGSSLQILLAHGIIPDYHVELENVVQVWDFLQHILELNQDKFPDGRFTGIKLIASVTLNPRVTPLFDEAYYFFRDSVSSTRCFVGDIPIMSGVGPNVANTIMAVTSRMGFRDVYLFGMDNGWHDGEAHHSKNTAYYTHKDFKTAKQSGEYTLTGNFGGEIQSNMLLSWTRDMLEQMIRSFGLRAFNCSDGALIRGAVPKLSETLDFAGPPINRPQAYDRVRNATTFTPKGTYLASFDFDLFIDEIDAFAAEIEAMCDEALEHQEDFRSMLRHLTEMNRKWPDSPYRHVYAVFQGATIGMAKCGCVFLNRIEDDEKRRRVFLDFIDEYRKCHQDMAEEARDIFRDAKAWLAGGPEPKWAAGLQTMPGYTF